MPAVKPYPTLSLWGEPPWTIDFKPAARTLPEQVDFAVVGGGFTGLAAAVALRRLAPEKTVAVLEASSIGGGASGRTGGIALAGTAAGEMPELGDALAGFADFLREVGVDAGLQARGVWEIGRSRGRRDSPIEWRDSGTLRVVNEVPGGTIDPGRLLSGLGRAAERLGALVFEHAPVLAARFQNPLVLLLPPGELRAHRVLFATNAFALDLLDLVGRAQPKFTLAVATAPLGREALEALGLTERKPFYTLDLPYLWGRVLSSGGIVFGAGLVHVRDGGELNSIDVDSGEARELLDGLMERVRGLHPVLASVEFTHRWGGPILFTPDWNPIFCPHPASNRALILAGYCGHGVALSVHLGRWAAEVLAGRRNDLPEFET